MTEFVSRKYGEDGYKVIIKTDDKEQFKLAEAFARRLIDHGKPMARIEKIRSMSVAELAKLIYRSNEPEMFCKGSEKCLRRIAADEDIPEEECLACVAKWLLEEV